MKGALPTLLLVAAIGGGCTVDDSKVTLRCDAENPCPDGQVCGDGICSTADMASTDGSADGANQSDMSMSGCAGSGGRKVGAAFACPGAFVAGKAADQCANNFHICTSGELSSVDVPACNQLSGFFVVSVPGYYLNPNRDTVTCGTAGVGNPVWFGCGGLSSASVHEHLASKCSNLARSVDCSMPAGPWFCSASGDMSKTENKSATDGVVCCP